MSFINVAAATPHIKSGRVRAWGISSVQPSALLPESLGLRITVYHLAKLRKTEG